jgi:predicted nucleic acid-binding protein
MRHASNAHSANMPSCRSLIRAAQRRAPPAICLRLRELDITIRKTADIVIGLFCIEQGYRLFHDDRDFAPMEQHLGLQVA